MWYLHPAHWWHYCITLLMRHYSDTTDYCTLSLNIKIHWSEVLIPAESWSEWWCKNLQAAGIYSFQSELERNQFQSRIFIPFCVDFLFSFVVFHMVPQKFRIKQKTFVCPSCDFQYAEGSHKHGCAAALSAPEGVLPPLLPAQLNPCKSPERLPLHPSVSHGSGQQQWLHRGRQQHRHAVPVLQESKPDEQVQLGGTSTLLYILTCVTDLCLCFKFIAFMLLTSTGEEWSYHSGETGKLLWWPGGCWYSIRPRCPLSAGVAAARQE